MRRYRPRSGEAEANERRRESRTLPMAGGGSQENYKSPAALAGCLYHLQAVTRGCYESCEYFHHIHKYPPNKFFSVCSSIPSRDVTNFPCMMAHQFGCLQPKRVRINTIGLLDGMTSWRHQTVSQRMEILIKLPFHLLSNPQTFFPRTVNKVCDVRHEELSERRKVLPPHQHHRL